MNLYVFKNPPGDSPRLYYGEGEESIQLCLSNQGKSCLGMVEESQQSYHGGIGKNPLIFEI